MAYPLVHYTYQVMGQAYQGNKIAPGPGVGGTGAQKTAEQYPIGAQVMVYYDPNNPAEAVLERNMPGYVNVLWAVVILIGLCLCGMAAFIALLT